MISSPNLLVRPATAVEKRTRKIVGKDERNEGEKERERPPQPSCHPTTNKFSRSRFLLSMLKCKVKYVQRIHTLKLHVLVCLLHVQ